MPVQAAFVDLAHGKPAACQAFLNRLYVMLNWTLTEFTVSAQVGKLSSIGVTNWCL